jgi:uncharacterized RDD family membrane protein YckC
MGGEMIVVCPDCSSKAKFRDNLAGKTVRCPQCNVEFIAKTQKWYYVAGSKKIGPLPQEQFDELVNDGTIGLETLVWHKGMREWQALDQTGPAVEAKNKWYYSVGNEKIGPLAQQQFDRAVADGVISGETLVWRKGLSVWQSLSDVQAGKMVAEAGPHLKPAGWGGRSMAKIIDMIFMLALAGMVEGLSRKLFPAAYVTPDSLNPVLVATMTINMLLGIFYITWFVGKFGATPGKMAFKLKIVKSSGAKLGYGQAFGRYCGEFIVVFLTLMIGYLFGVFDSQKRTLHDRLCNTRVIAV